MPSLIQSATNTVTSGTSVTVTLGSSTGNGGAGGTALVVYVATHASTSPATVSNVKLGGSADNFGATAANKETGTSDNAEIWLDLNCATGQTSVVVTLSAGTSIALVRVEEWLQLVTSAGLDTHPTGATSTSSGTFTSNSTGTLAQANEVVFGCVGSHNAGTVSITGPSSPWTNASLFASSNTCEMMTGYNIVSATTAQTYNGTQTAASDYACVVISVKATNNVSGTGSFKLAPLAFSGSGAEKFTGTGTFTLAPLTFGGANHYYGTGTLALASLKLSGTNIAIPPTIPVEPAGVIAKSSDHNQWSQASAFFLDSFAGDRPVFFLMASTTQSLTTSFTAVNYSSSATVYKDNNGAWNNSNPSRATFRTAGYYHIEWSVSITPGAGNLFAYAQVTTGAGNPFNPSTTVKFQYSARRVPASGNTTAVSAGGLVPIYLVAGDYVEVYAEVGTSEATSASAYPQLCGLWVSS